MELFHITSIRNLENILSSGMILSKNRLLSSDQDHLSIAYEGIQERRSLKSVPCSPFGVLHDYVPFYFAPRSPMLYAIHHGRVEGYREGQAKIIYLVTEVSKVVEGQIAFIFSDGHPVMNYTIFYNDLRKLDQKIDWEVMQARYWSDTQEEPDRKRRRQAEFLVYKYFPINLLTTVGVFNREILEDVTCINERFDYVIDCQIRRDWYY